MDNWNAKQRVIVQIVCVLLSIILWVYVTNIENPLKTIELDKVSVQLLNSDVLAESGQILAPNQDITVSLKLEGSIQDIYKVSAEDFSAVIDLEPYALKFGENTISVTIVDSPSNITIKNLSGLTATIVVEELTEKEVPVESEVSVTAKNNYYVSPAIADPEKVTVSGAKSLIDRVDKVVVSGVEDNVDQTIVKNYDIYAVDINGDRVDGVTLSQSSVQITIRVNEGKNVPINVVTTGELPNGLKLVSAEVKEKSIDISGPEDILSSINEINTKPINLSEITEDTSIEVQLQIPDGLENQSQSTVTVNITLEKIKTKEFEIIFAMEGLSADFEAVTDSDKVKVTLSGYSNDIDAITEADIKATLDLSSINSVGEYTLNPDIDITKENTSIVIDSVSSIKVTISNKKEDTSNGEDEGSQETSGSDINNGDSDNNNSNPIE